MKKTVNNHKRGIDRESTRESGEIRQKQIIEAAIRCFGRKGYEKTTIDDIAAEYGLSKGSIYWYYSSKKHILIAVFEHILSELFVNYQAQITSGISPKQKLLNILRLFFEMMLKNYETCRPFIVLMGAAYEDEDLQKMGSDMYVQAEQKIMEVLAEGEDAGEFHVADKKTTAELIIAVCEGLLTRQILVQDLDLVKIEMEMERVVERFIFVSNPDNTKKRRVGKHV